MSPDTYTMLCNAAALLLAFGVLRLVMSLWRLLLPVALILFCVSAYGWGCLALFLWFCADGAHRRDMAERRAASEYNGPWID